MLNDLKNNYVLISPDKIHDFITSNKNTLTILDAMEPHLIEHFPNNKFSLEVCDKLGWTTETKLLLNVQVDEEMFFNGMLDHFNDIYKRLNLSLKILKILLFYFRKSPAKNLIN